MSSVTITEGQGRLAELLQNLQAGEECTIVENGRVIAKIVAIVAPAEGKQAQRKLGFLAGSVEHMSDDFDAPIPDMQEYMA